MMFISQETQKKKQMTTVKGMVHCYCPVATAHVENLLSQVPARVVNEMLL